MHRVWPWVFVACVLGCARNTVKPVSESRAAPPPRPTIVLVYDPEFRAADVVENQSTVALAASPSGGQDDRDNVGKQAAAAFASKLVDDIRKLGVKAERAGPGTQVPANALVVVAKFIDVDEGNRMKRLVVGFGSGASHIDARVQLFGASTKLLEFDAHSDSGKMPGGGVTLGLGLLVIGPVTAFGAVSDVASGAMTAHMTAIEKLAAKSGAQASHYLSEYFGKQGWIAADRVKTANQ
jgi:hypothetical protein